MNVWLLWSTASVAVPALGALLAVAVVAPRLAVRHRVRRDCRAGPSSGADLATFDAADSKVDGRALVAALEVVARLVRTGSSLRDALVSATDAPLNQQGVHPMRTLGLELRRGFSVADSARRWRERTADRASQLAACALVLAATGGGEQARAVDAAADVVRDRLALAANVRAHAAQARLSALVLVVAPVVFTAWTVASERSVRAFVFGSPIGFAVLTVGVALDVVGALWMAALCRSVTA